jgi:hypothetical protein
MLLRTFVLCKDCVKSQAVPWPRNPLRGLLHGLAASQNFMERPDWWPFTKADGLP